MKKDEHFDDPARESKKPDPFYDRQTTTSAMECTGLIPAGLEDENEAEAYGDLYSIHRQSPTELVEET